MNATTARKLAASGRTVAVGEDSNYRVIGVERLNGQLWIKVNPVTVTGLNGTWVRAEDVHEI